jgi:hypothetical protein
MKSKSIKAEKTSAATVFQKKEPSKMDIVKLNGVLETLLLRWPNVDLVEFLQDELHLPASKAEILAQRIEKKYCQESAKTKTSLRRILQKPLEDQPHPEGGYFVDCLSDYEFGHFMRWLLEGSGFKILNENKGIDSGVDFVAEKDEKTIVIVARKYPKNIEVSETVFLISERAKQVHGCTHSIVAVTTYFSDQAKAEAQRLGIEMWDSNVLGEKIEKVRRKDLVESPLSFPDFNGSLLASLLRLEELKDFVVERRMNGKFELFLAGVKFPLLTFQAEEDRVVSCVFRMKNYKPVGEHEAQTLIWTDEANNRLGPKDLEVYNVVTKYLKDFIE